MRRTSRRKSSTPKPLCVLSARSCSPPYPPFWGGAASPPPLVGEGAAKQRRGGAPAYEHNSDSEILAHQRQLTDTMTGRGEDRIAYRRRERRQRRFAQSGRRVIRLDEVRFDFGRMRHAQDRIIVEICLLHAAIFHRDLEAEHSGEPVDHRALNLSLRAAHIDHRPDI